MVKITINGQEVSAEESRTILEVARELGFEIPTLCYYRAVSPYGACRVCLVEITDDRGSRLTASCSFMVQEGLKVETASTRVLEARKVMVELLLVRSPNSPKLREMAAELSVAECETKQNGDCIL